MDKYDSWDSLKHLWLKHENNKSVTVSQNTEMRPRKLVQRCFDQKYAQGKTPSGPRKLAKPVGMIWEDKNEY